ncbi:bifunctional metallophosphatase/5'-nucleotidase [Pseudomonas sp. Irchel 3F3]|uniref:bifunctional metallophosphatase/5'-nucleotidase n=1 Tax=Pseudomonas sp. Irchel 3F3 TaxID=2009000 RepID=UPI000BA44084|nr:bifunctional metallophosphatase/5'-nucleotidase [Pseudomonas sp. Irchel 3F3]
MKVRLSCNCRSAIAWACLAFSGGSLAAESPAPVQINVVAINDLHGYMEPNPQDYPSAQGVTRLTYGGIATLGAMLDELRKQDPELLFIGAGDLIGGSPATSALWADEPVLEALNSMGMIVSSSGNHELDAGKAEFLRQIHGGCESTRPEKACKFRGTFPGSGFPYIASNLIDTTTGKRLLPAYHIQEVKGVKIAFVGAVPRNMEKVVSARAFTGLKATDEAHAINEVIPELKAKGVNAIIAVMHQGGHTSEPFDKQDCSQLDGAIVNVAKRLDPAVDAVISGHSHASYQCKVGDLSITQAGKYGHFMTQLKLEVTPGTHNVKTITARNLPVDPQAYVPNAKLTSLLEEVRHRSGEKLLEPIGRIATADLNRKVNAAGETTLGNFVTDAQLAMTQAFQTQIAFLNLGGLRSDLIQPANSDLTYEQLFAVQPFDNPLVVQELTGKQIIELLNLQWNRGNFNPLQVSKGFHYEWDGSRPAGSRVVEESVRLDGKRVEPSTYYRVVSNLFLADGGGGLTTLKEGRQRQDAGISDVEALVAYVRQNHARGVAIGQSGEPRISMTP